MVLRPGGSVAIVGAGPSGLVSAKYALDAGLNPTLFEATDALGGQWNTSAAHSGIWPGMHTNTSRAMTAFSDFPGPSDWPLHPAAEQIRDYLNAYAEHFELVDRIRFGTPVTTVTPEWRVNGEPFDALVVASGRFRRPHIPNGLDGFSGELIHAFDYPGAHAFRDRRALVYGNGVSGHEIASDIAAITPVVSAYRKPRYVIQKVSDGVPSDWQWYTAFGALQRRFLPRATFANDLRRRIVSSAGDPADFGAPQPDTDILVAGVSLCQDYLRQVADGQIACWPAISAVSGRDVTFTDGSRETVESIVCATGYQLDVPFLAPELQVALGHLHLRTLSPDLPNFAAVGQFLAQGPYFGLLELQARWAISTWTGQVGRPQLATTEPGVDPHNVLATAIADELGVTPDPRAWPELAEALLFGPMLPARYRLSGPGAAADAPEWFRHELNRSPRPAVDPADVEALAEFGLSDVARILRR